MAARCGQTVDLRQDCPQDRRPRRKRVAVGMRADAGAAPGWTDAGASLNGSLSAFSASVAREHCSGLRSSVDVDQRRRRAALGREQSPDRRSEETPSPRIRVRGSGSRLRPHTHPLTPTHSPQAGRGRNRQAALRSSNSIWTFCGPRRKAMRTPGRIVFGSTVNSAPFCFSSSTTLSMPSTRSPICSSPR
jgi:hypothetical protein